MNSFENMKIPKKGYGSPCVLTTVEQCFENGEHS